MIYRRPGFFIWLHSPPPSSPPPSPVSKLGRRHRGRLRKRDKLLTGEGVGSGVGAKSYDGEKAWSLINHSVHSDFDVLYCKKFSVIYAVINVAVSSGSVYWTSPILVNDSCRIRHRIRIILGTWIRIRIREKSWVRIRICQNSGALDAQHGVVEARGRSHGTLKIEPWRVCRPAVTDSHHFDEEQD